MGKGIIPPPQVARATADLRAAFPAAELSWDTRLPTYMLTVTVNGSVVRAFIERADLEPHGEAYEKFKKRVIELVSASLDDKGVARDWRINRAN